MQLVSDNECAKELYHSLANNLGIIYNIQGHHKKALKHLELSLKYDQENGILEGVSESYNNIGETHMDMGNYESAGKYFKKSIGIKKLTGDAYGMSQTLHNMGQLFLQRRQFADSLHFFKKSREVKTTITKEKIGLADTSLAVAQVLVYLGDHAAAKVELEKVISVLSKSGNEPKYLKAKKVLDGIKLHLKPA